MPLATVTSHHQHLLLAHACRRRSQRARATMRLIAWKHVLMKDLWRHFIVLTSCNYGWCRCCRRKSSWVVDTLEAKNTPCHPWPLHHCWRGYGGMGAVKVGRTYRRSEEGGSKPFDTTSFTTTPFSTTGCVMLQTLSDRTQTLRRRYQSFFVQLSFNLSIDRKLEYSAFCGKGERLLFFQRSDN